MRLAKMTNTVAEPYLPRDRRAVPAIRNDGPPLGHQPRPISRGPRRKNRGVIGEEEARTP
jgi:hypothetical protein